MDAVLVTLIITAILLIIIVYFIDSNFVYLAIAGAVIVIGLLLPTGVVKSPIVGGASLKLISPDEAYEKIKDSKIIFVIGKAASGKTTFSRRFSDTHAVVELDNIIVDIARKFGCNRFRAFNIYKGKSDKELETAFINETRKLIEDGIKTKGKVVIEGVISHPRIFNLVMKNYDYKLVFLYPTSAARYTERIKKRFEIDYKNSTKTLPLWRSIPESILEDYSREGFKTAEIEKYFNLQGEKYVRLSQKLYSMINRISKNIITVEV